LALTTANPATHAATTQRRRIVRRRHLVSPCGTLRIILAGSASPAPPSARATTRSQRFLELYCREIEQLPREKRRPRRQLCRFSPAGRVLACRLSRIPGPANLHPLLAKAESALRALWQTWRAAADTPGMADRARRISRTACRAEHRPAPGGCARRWRKP
jgi:hypothetical protein